jgi:cytochrome c553
MEQAEEIYDRQGHAFRLKLEFDLILRNTETGEFRYFRAYGTYTLFKSSSTSHGACPSCHGRDCNAPAPDW